jgi:hypothetical protein
MKLIEDDRVVQTFAADRSDESPPRRSRPDHDLFDADPLTRAETMGRVISGALPMSARTREVEDVLKALVDRGTMLILPPGRTQGAAAHPSDTSTATEDALN